MVTLLHWDFPPALGVNSGGERAEGGRPRAAPVLGGAPRPPAPSPSSLGQRALWHVAQSRWGLSSARFSCSAPTPLARCGAFCELLLLGRERRPVFK